MPTRPTVTAVIPHFYEARAVTLLHAIEALFTGSTPPDEVIVWDNTGDLYKLPRIAQVQIVSSPRNVGPQARFLAALMATTDYVFFQDNDVAVGKHTLEDLLAARDAGMVICEGVIAQAPKPYRHWSKVYGKSLAAAEQVNVALGRGDLLLRSMLPAVLNYYPFDPSTVMDDLYFSEAAAVAGVPIYVVPVRDGLTDLRGHGTGLCTTPGWYDQRNDVAQRLFGPTQTIRPAEAPPNAVPTDQAT